tara:strand:- start:6958 stop:7437 length:480 start_codon:yes stop_codon:yes gene_type:complete
MQKQRFRAPVPGQGMTAGLNSRPWLNPPRFNTVEEGLEFYLEMLSTQEKSTNLFSVVKTGLPLTIIAESMTTGGVMEGLHSVDVGLLLNPLLVEFIKGMCDVAKVEYTLDTSVPEKDRVNMRAIKEVMEEELKEKEPEIKQAGEQVKKQAGLMAKREIQ